MPFSQLPENFKSMKTFEEVNDFDKNNQELKNNKVADDQKQVVVGLGKRGRKSTTES